jgi:hypothetical protein
MLKKHNINRVLTKNGRLDYLSSTTFTSSNQATP